MRVIPTRLSPSLALLLVGFAGPASAELVDGIVLRVDSRMATLSEYQQRRSERIQQIFGANIAPEDKARLLEEAGRAALLEIYQELLLLARADQLAMRVSSDEVERALEQNRQRMGLASRAELEAALAESGRSLDDLRERTELNLLVQQVVGREVQAKAIPSEEEARRYYREHPEEFATPTMWRVREILVRADAFDDGASLDAAGAFWRARLDAGATLDEVAVEGSAAGQTSSVIDLDWVAAADLDAALAGALATAVPGSVVGPVAARGGLHLLEVVERKEAGSRSFSEVDEAIRRKLAEGRFEELLEALLERLEQQAWIVVNAPEDAAGFLDRGASATPTDVPN